MENGVDELPEEGALQAGGVFVSPGDWHAAKGRRFQLDQHIDWWLIGEADPVTVSPHLLHVFILEHFHFSNDRRYSLAQNLF